MGSRDFRFSYMGKANEMERVLIERPRAWLVTGVAGFIGSHLLEGLLKLKQRVVGIDNFVSGHSRNLEQVRHLVGERAWQSFEFQEGDIRDFDFCQTACRGIEIVLHEAALGSVPRSLEDPRTCHDVNVTGFVNMLLAAQQAGAGRFIFASSSAVYGDSSD